MVLRKPKSAKLLYQGSSVTHTGKLGLLYKRHLSVYTVNRHNTSKNEICPSVTKRKTLPEAQRNQGIESET